MSTSKPMYSKGTKDKLKKGGKRGFYYRKYLAFWLKSALQSGKGGLS